MTNKLAQIEFYFPEGAEKLKSKKTLVDLIIDEMKPRGSISYSGYANEALLKKGLLSHIDDGDESECSNLSKNEKEKIEKVIQETMSKCNAILPVPIENYVFVFPWFPNRQYEMFRSTLGHATYHCVFHIFLSVGSWREDALANSVAHELNHTIFYYYHQDRFNNYNLLDELVMEGLAENFRERSTDPNPSPWSSALTEEEAFRVLNSLENKFGSTDKEFIQSILFGNEEYKRWSGYSAGYWLVKKFIQENTHLSWEEVMKKEPREIFDAVFLK